VAITGKPPVAATGEVILERGDNAIDAACALIASTWHTLS
jgi:hypothetical protein